MWKLRTLPIAHAVVVALIVLNWVYGAIVLSILVGLFTNAHWTMSAIGVSAEAQTPTFLNGMRAIAAVGLLAVPLNLALLKRLLAMIATVRAGDPFIALNARRLDTIAVILLGQQLLSMAAAMIGRAISTPAHRLHLDAGFSPSAWLAVVLAFVLARVFAEGARMRDDLEGTV